jgi:NAD(P)-dependent dehydrogenase (short-subunit alcohol dehydrogenase family)
MIADLTTPADFDGKVALVTGGASGIGEATVRLLAARGASVIVADLDGDRASGLAREIGPSYARAVAVDVASPEAVDAMVAAAVEAFGRLDVAVNAAGVSGSWVPVAERDLDEWQQVIGINLTGTFLCLRAELRQMTAQVAEEGRGDDGGASVVNVASGAGEMGVAGLAHYSASKHGVVGLTRSAALEVARSGIRVNGVLPGPTRTPMLQASAGGDDGVDAMGKMMPAGRAGEAAEVAQAIAWLCSDQASYVTGHLLAVDGGALAT